MANADYLAEKLSMLLMLQPVAYQRDEEDEVEGVSLK